MHIGNDKTSRSYQMNDHIFENVNEKKDLGGITDYKLNSHNHSYAAIKKANSVLGLIKRSFVALDKSILPELYMSMLRPGTVGKVIPHQKSSKFMRDYSSILCFVWYLTDCPISLTWLG